MSLSKEELFSHVESHCRADFDSDVLENDTDVIVYLMDNCKISVPENNRFFVEVNADGLGCALTWIRSREIDEKVFSNGYKEDLETLAYTGTFDISHTTPKWENLYSLGFSGLKQKVLILKNINDTRKNRFYTQVLKIYDAIERFLIRASQTAQAAGRHEMAEGLLNLSKHAPENLFEAMQLSFAYYVFQHFFEGTYLRTMGRIDTLLYPFRIKESKTKTTELLFDYFSEADTLKAPANLPFTLSCFDVCNNISVANLTEEILDVYISSNFKNIKFHLLCGDNTPEYIISKAFTAVQNGKNSIIFMSDNTVIKSLKKMGVPHQDAMNYHVEGCYEAASDGEMPCTSNARVCLPKALELTLNGGKDMLTGNQTGPSTDSLFNSFEELYQEFKNQISHLCKKAMELTDLYESQYNKLHCAPLLSSTYDYTLQKGSDIYCDYGAKYNNSSLNALGLATAVDSLIAIKKLVFDEKRFTLSHLINILKSDWENEEALRIYAKNKLPKFGIGDAEADWLAKDIADSLSSFVSGKPNSKGGQWRLGLLSINWRWEFGEKCAASADGRHCGETLSQNCSATFGADREGATAHLTSICSIDATNVPNGVIADIDIHSSATRGIAGNKVLCALVKTYFELGGFGVHFNILDTEILQKAKENPESYPNLQVRLCGWNVLFSSLSDKEKEEFIARSSK